MVTQSLPKSYEQLLSDPQYRQLITKIAYKYTKGSSVYWEDAVQVAHMKIFQAVQAGKFRPQLAPNFSPWAATIARNAIVDFVRYEKRRNCRSLEETISGTDLSLADTIADESNQLEAVEQADLLQTVMQAIKKLAISHPERQYMMLWQGLVKGKKQTQLAAELGVNQSEISRRRKELLGKLAKELNLLPESATATVSMQNLNYAIA
ncbi:MAG: sigma-70 family RNA polymerase sigma factor [Calothrix sp. MO_192.B10]|nr:sigma-70 family RNA polymerase sigma factor [Calothrix sp. MO_192.B10]